VEHLSKISAKKSDWEAFFDLQDLFQDSKDLDVQKEIERGQEALRKEHDILEKPLKEAGIISGKTKDTSKNKNGRVRNYEKEGGEKQRQKDFDKIEGEYSKAKDGTEKKVLPDGTTVVKRPDEDTIEVQAPKGDPRYPFKGTKVKVRYP
jgi:hypothetical protein